MEQKELLIPNKELITGQLLNWTLTDTKTRILIDVGITYGSDVDRAMKILHELAREDERVLEDPAPGVVFNLFGDNSLNLAFRLFVGTLRGPAHSDNRYASKHQSPLQRGRHCHCLPAARRSLRRRPATADQSGAIAGIRQQVGINHGQAKETYVLSGIRFTIERWLLRGLHYRLILAAAVVAFVAISAGLLALLLDTKFEDAGAAIWWSFLRLTDPGYLGDDEGAVSVTISTIVTVLGYVLFLGLLSAILTQWMNTLILRVESGTTRVAFKNHILILGWNYRTPSIVLELLQTGGRVSRFLKDSGAHNLRIVILAEQVDAELREELKSSLEERWDDRRVVLRSGSPLKLDGLERVAFHDAAAVILPGADFATARPGVADSEIIKTLASIAECGKQARRTPSAVAALFNANRADVARRAYDGELEVITADQLVSRLITQCTLQPGLWSIYWELFSLNQDNALYVRELDADHVTDIGQARLACPKAVVIGVIPSNNRTPILNPPGDMPIKSGDALIFIARHFADCRLTDVVAPASIAQMPGWYPVASETETVLILGWSRKVPKVLAELLSYQQQLTIDVAGITPVSEREISIDSVVSAQQSGTFDRSKLTLWIPIWSQRSTPRTTTP